MIKIRLTSTFTVNTPEETNNRNIAISNAPLETDIIQKQQQSQKIPLSTPMNIGRPAQLNATDTVRQLSLANMHFDCLQLDVHLARRSSMSGQFNLVSRPRSPHLNEFANAPLTLNLPSHKCTGRSIHGP